CPRRGTPAWYRPPGSKTVEHHVEPPRRLCVGFWCRQGSCFNCRIDGDACEYWIGSSRRNSSLHVARTMFRTARRCSKRSLQSRGLALRNAGGPSAVCRPVAISAARQTSNRFAAALAEAASGYTKAACSCRSLTPGETSGG